MARPRLDVATKALRNTKKDARERRRAGVSAAQQPGPVAAPGPRDYVAIGLQYARDAVAGVVIVNLLVRLLAKWHLRQLAKAGSDPTYTFVFSDWHAVDVCQFCERLP